MVFVCLFVFFFFHNVHCSDFYNIIAFRNLFTSGLCCFQKAIILSRDNMLLVLGAVGKMSVVFPKVYAYRAKCAKINGIINSQTSTCTCSNVMELLTYFFC